MKSIVLTGLTGIILFCLLSSCSPSTSTSSVTPPLEVAVESSSFPVAQSPTAVSSSDSSSIATIQPPTDSSSSYDNSLFTLEAASAKYSPDLEGYEQFVETVYLFIVNLRQEATGPDALYAASGNGILGYCMRVRQDKMIGPIEDLFKVEDYTAPFADIERISEIATGKPITREITQSVDYGFYYDPETDEMTAYIYWGADAWAHIINVYNIDGVFFIESEITVWNGETGEINTLGYFKYEFIQQETEWGTLYQIQSVSEIPAL